MKPKKLLSMILCFLLTLSLSVTTFAMEIPQNDQNVIVEETPKTEHPETEQKEPGVDETKPEATEPEITIPEEAGAETSEPEDITPESAPAEGQKGTSEVSPYTDALEADKTKAVDNSIWTVEDFIYTEMSQSLNGCDYTREFTIKGRAVAGLSEYGNEKIKTNKNLVIPSTDDSGTTLVGVAPNAFKSLGIETVEIPTGMMVDYNDTVTNGAVTRRGNFIIGSSAFANNNLTKVYLPEGVIAVMPQAFFNNKISSVTFPRTIWWIENQSFAKNQLPNVNFPKTCDFQLQIKALAFAYNNIKSVRLPDYTEAVDKRVFYWNTGVEAIPADAPDKEKEFGGLVYMYTDNANLQNMERIHHIGRTAESQKSWHQKLVVGSNPDATSTWELKDFQIEGTVITGLSESGAAKRKVTKELVLPDRNEKGEYITEIAGSTNTYGAFGAENEGFDSVELPSQVKKIGNKAFTNIGLKAIAFPSTLTEIGLAAFQINKLTSVILPDSVTTLGGGAFASNPTIERITLSKNLKVIAAGAFGCSDKNNWMEKLTVLTIPEGVEKIEKNAFAGNNIVDIVIPASVKEIGEYAFSTKNYLKTKATLTLSEGIETIGDRAFRNKIIESVELPATVKTLPSKVFEKEYSDDTEVVVTKVFVKDEAQYNNTEKFPKSTFHKLYFDSVIVWTADDFTYGTLAKQECELYPANDPTDKIVVDCWTVTGLSDTGKEKIEVNKDLVIPAKDPDGKVVNGVGAKAFQKLGIETLKLPEGVMTDYSGKWNTQISKRGNFIIGSSAFLGNKLTVLDLPKGVVKVGGSAFNGNTLTNVTLPHTLLWIGAQAFVKNQISSLVFPETCDFKLSIDTMAFGVNQIGSVRLPDRCEKIDKTAFMQNTGKEPITDGTAAENKGGIVYMYTDNEDLKKEALLAHRDNATSKSKVQKLIVGEMPSEEKPWNIEDFTIEGTKLTGLSELGKKKVELNPNVVLPDQNKDGKDITTIGKGSNGAPTFGVKATGVILPEKLQKIENFAFSGSQITSINLPKTLVELQQSAFQSSKLKEIVLPNSVTTIGQGVFSNCTELTKVVLSNRLTAIEMSTFTMTAIKELVIPEGITSIGSRAFAGTGMTALTLPGSLEEIGANAFENHQLTEVVIPEHVKKIGNYAFRVKQEGLGATLNSLIIKGNLEEIAKQTFAKSKLTNVVIPESLVKLDASSFSGGVNGDVTLIASSKKQLEASNGYVPSAAGSHNVVYDKLANSGWEYEDFMYEGSTIKGWSETGHAKRLKNLNLVLPEENPNTKEAITAIGEAAFQIPDGEWEQLKDSIYSPNGMKSVKLPETLQVIGKKAFQYNSLTEVSFGTALTSIGESAFHGNRLTGVELPDNIAEVQSGAFSTNDITKIRLSNGLTKLQQGVFSMNIRLEQIDIPETITEIGDMAFAGARLTKLNIPKSVTKIGRKAFHLHHLTELTIPGNVKELGDSAFEGTFKAITLKKLTIEEGVETIGSLAFKEGYLERVTLPESLSGLAKDAFYANTGVNNNHVVELYTSNPFHGAFEASDSHNIVVNVVWKADRFTYDGTTLTGLTDKGKAYLQGASARRAVSGYTTEVILPNKNPQGEDIKKIADEAFRGYGLTKVTLPNQLEEIGKNAFAENALTTVALPDTMEKLEPDAFKGNQSNVKITASESIVEKFKDVQLEGATIEISSSGEEPTPDVNPGGSNSGNSGGNNGSNSGANNSGNIKNTSQTKAAQTGDEAPIIPISLMAGAGLLMMLTAMTKRKKQG